MTVAQIKQSIKDIIPSYDGEDRTKLTSYIDSLYNLSLRHSRVLPNNSEIARYHLCTFVIIEKYKNLFDLPQPDVSRIPIQPQIAKKLLEDFREFVNQLSASSTPVSTPKKQKPAAPISTPRQSGSPLKKIQALASSPSPSPSKNSTRYDFKTVSIEEFITFCNAFYIPSEFTKQMLKTFYSHKHKFAKKSDWSLACGIVYAAYMRINHLLLSTKMGARSEFMTLLLQYQKGGLSKDSLQTWCSLVEEWVKDEQWVQDIERQYVFGNQTIEEKISDEEYRGRIGDGWEQLERLGAMIHGEVLYQSDSQIEYYKNWSEKACNAC
ncbi:uncharacterized protein KGF55_004154 [Candida pseudojiufengensis]|uniref:uncharacterized protein n=1 Tax=Candida pseudojiufengensis TaxID=497109 RepID=UPI00222464A0|nr:uncharacterized protein KGF55_004154 [Candida pseudojiufengensis]KAI5961229.1 hypothetical protein KGF55_004154 [Candida pseudojiufengensis]